MKVQAECGMQSTAGVTAKPTRIIDGGTVNMRAVPVQSTLTSEKLGGKNITLKLTGLTAETTARVIRLIEALKSADADEAAKALDELKELAGE